jgi:spermidine/putrescine-binding protein
LNSKSVEVTKRLEGIVEALRRKECTIDELMPKGSKDRRRTVNDLVEIRKFYGNDLVTKYIPNTNDKTHKGKQGNKRAYRLLSSRPYVPQERWKGKIAYADPHKSGSCYTALVTLMQVMGKDNLSAIEQFSNVLDGKILEGSGEVIDEVASGTKLVGITLEETAMKRIAAGVDITMVYPQEGTSAVPDGSALILHAPHEENARLFLDFIMDRDVQRMIVDKCYRRSMRKDISGSETWYTEDAKFIDFDLMWASDNRNEILNKWDILNQ